MIKILKEKYTDPIIITIETNKFTASECLLPLLEELRKLCHYGSSREIKIINWDENNSFYMDGDGAHNIKKITVKEIEIP